VTPDASDGISHLRQSGYTRGVDRHHPRVSPWPTTQHPQKPALGTGFVAGISPGVVAGTGVEGWGGWVMTHSWGWVHHTMGSKHSQQARRATPRCRPCWRDRGRWWRQSSGTWGQSPKCDPRRKPRRPPTSNRRPSHPSETGPAPVLAGARHSARQQRASQQQTSSQSDQADDRRTSDWKRVRCSHRDWRDWWSRGHPCDR